MKPSIGRIVHVVLPEVETIREHARGAHRAALVVSVVDSDPSDLTQPAKVNLQVSLDPDDIVDAAEIEFRVSDASVPTTAWMTSVPEDQDTMAPGSWHWPERADG